MDQALPAALLPRRPPRGSFFALAGFRGFRDTIVRSRRIGRDSRERIVAFGKNSPDVGDLPRGQPVIVATC